MWQPRSRALRPICSVTSPGMVSASASHSSTERGRYWPMMPYSENTASLTSPRRSAVQSSSSKMRPRFSSMISLRSLGSTMTRVCC